MTPQLHWKQHIAAPQPCVSLDFLAILAPRSDCLAEVKESFTLTTANCGHLPNGQCPCPHVAFAMEMKVNSRAGRCNKVFGAASVFLRAPDSGGDCGGISAISEVGIVLWAWARFPL